jgi:glycosyltransferase involved in cell wall biosynthesis
MRGTIAVDTPRTIVMFANSDWYLYNFRLEAAKAIRDRGDRLILLSPHGKYGRHFKAHGLNWYAMPMRRASLNPIAALRSGVWLYRFLKMHQVHILHAFTIKCVILGGTAARMHTGTARVCAIAGLGAIFTVDGLAMRLLRLPVRWALKWAMGGADVRVIVQNRDDAREIIQQGLAAPCEVRVILGSGVDLARFQGRARPRGEGRLTVLLAARLLRSKGVVEFVQASQCLARRGKNITFLLAGMPDPENRDSITEAEVRQWEASGAVQWLGHVQDMPSLLGQVDVFALPSFYGEGLPKSLIEAAASRVALITTDLPGCREVVAVDGRDGLHVIPSCAMSLADAIERLDTDRDLLRQLQDAARARAEACFGIEGVIGATAKVYDELHPHRWTTTRASLD